MDILTITEKLETLKPNTITLGDSKVYIWNVYDEDRWLKISFISATKYTLVQLDIMDTEVELSDCTVVCIEAMEMIMELYETLEFTKPMCSMPMQAQVDLIMQAFREIIDDEF